MFSVGSVCDVAIQQQVLVEMPQRRQLARHAAPIDSIRQQRVQEVAHVLPPRIPQPALSFQQKLGILLQIGLVGRNAERRQSLLDLQIVEKRVQQPQIGIGTLHKTSMARARHAGITSEIQPASFFRTASSSSDGIQRAARVFLVLEERIGLQPIGQATLHSIGQLAEFGGIVVWLAEAKVNVLRGSFLWSGDRLRLSDTKRDIMLSSTPDRFHR